MYIKQKTISILHFNDVYDIEGFHEEPVGGAARFAFLCKQFKQNHHNDGLIMFSGDLFSPSPLSILYKGEQMIEPINACEIDVSCVGNHEFDFSQEVAERLFSKCNFPWLCSNIFDTETNSIFANNHAYSIIEKNGFKIGVIGLAEQEWLDAVSEIDMSKVKYEDFIECSHRLVKILKEEFECDLIVALTHMRVPNDIKLGQQVPEIDLILGGHDHCIVEKYVNQNILIKSGSNFKQYSTIDIELIDNKSDIKIPKGYYNIKNKFKVKVNFFEVRKDTMKDEQVQKIVDLYVCKSKELMEEVIGHTHVDLDTRFEKIRTQETNFCNFYVDVIRNEVDAEICILNTGTVRSDCIFAAGPITYSMMNKALPFADIITVQEVSGLKVLQALENGVSQWPSFDGRFPCVSGIRFKFDGQKQAYQRIVQNSVFVGDQQLDMNRNYTVASKWFLSQGKDGYDMFKDCKFIIDQENGLPHLQIMISFFKRIENKNLQEKYSNLFIEQIEKVELKRSKSQVYQTQCSSEKNVRTLTRRKSRIEKYQGSEFIQDLKTIGEDQYISIAPNVEGRIISI